MGGKSIKGSSEKQGIRQKIRNTFIPEDVTDVGAYLLTEWVIPGIWDFIQTNVNQVVKGKPGSRITSTAQNLTGKPSAVARISQQVAYNKRYDQVHGKQQVDLGNYQYIKIDDRGDAEMVLMEMIDIIGTEDQGQGEVTVAWFLNRCQIEHIPAVTWNWGWRNLNKARVERFNNGWRIAFPPAVELKKEVIY